MKKARNKNPWFLSMRNSRSAQIRMAETIAILFIFFVLILFGLIFYAKYQKISLTEKKEEYVAKRAIDTTTKALFLPELICSKGKAESEDDCFDLIKLQYVNETFTSNLEKYYFDVFSFAKISVQEVYPEQRNWIIYDNPKENWTILEPTYFVVALRNDTGEAGTAQYSYGYLKVEVYS